MKYNGTYVGKDGVTYTVSTWEGKEGMIHVGFGMEWAFLSEQQFLEQFAEQLGIRVEPIGVPQIPENKLLELQQWLIA